LCSVPEHLLGSSLDARVDSQRAPFSRLAPSSGHKEGDDQTDDPQDRAEDPDRRMTQDLDTPEM
jgi:hypothetical protein